MVFDPLGRYPRGTLHVPNGFFHADEQIAFSVVLGEDWETADPDIPFSEFDWASPQELRLISSMLLCEVMDQGYVSLYPIVRFSPRLDVGSLDLSSADTVNDARALVLATADENGAHYEYSRIKACSRSHYNLSEPSSFSFDRLERIWRSLSPPNYVLMRGLYALMKSDMLSRHYEFCEEGVLSLHIALDASFSLVLRKLRSEGASNPSAHDAAQWIHKHFNAPFGLDAPDSSARYFEEFYEQRIMSMHPASRFGDLPYSPTMHDDLCHLRPWLRQVFAFLLIGEHDQGFLNAVAAHTSRT